MLDDGVYWYRRHAGRSPRTQIFGSRPGQSLVMHAGKSAEVSRDCDGVLTRFGEGCDPGEANEVRRDALRVDLPAVHRDGQHDAEVALQELAEEAGK